MKLDSETMRRHNAIRSGFIIFLTALCMSLIACSSLPKSYRKTPEKTIRDITTESRYKKKIGVATIQNYSSIKDRDLEKTFQQVMVKTIRSECKNALMVTSEDPESSAFLTAPPKLQNQVIDNFALSNIGREEGYNSIVTGSLSAITTREERKGMWGWRKTHYYMQILVFIDVYDTYNAAKAHSKPTMTEFKIKADDAEKIKAGQQIDLPSLEQHIVEMAQKAGNSVCAAVGSEIWKGFVIETQEKQVTLSCGESQGIRPGNKFEVFDSARTMEGFAGQKFYVPGFKIGEIEISRTSKEQSKAKVLTESPLPVGSVVVPKF